MHKEILVLEQNNLLPIVREFSRNFGLVGGTAIALLLGHRRSIDFDLFTIQPFDTRPVRQKILKSHAIERVLVDRNGEFTIKISGVQFTFYFYPFPITFDEKFSDIIALPDIQTLAAMKAYALGRRVKWKDYVDLYFIMQQSGGIAPVIQRARTIFGSEFNEKLFRVQLAYFKDIDYSEEIIYLPGFEMKDAEIRKGLIKFSLSET